MTPLLLMACDGGEILLPNARLVLVDRLDGGNLVVNPPRNVWERSELTAQELRDWAYLVSAVGQAMIDVLPQLAGGCINYWEAGNWALNHAAEPVGPKLAPERRSVHMHLLGRSPNARNSDWAWGEAPKFPSYVERFSWAAGNERLRPDECAKIVGRVEALLRDKFRMALSPEPTWRICVRCAYPTPLTYPHDCVSE